MMSNIKKLKLSINQFYPINLLEDEGVGLTYEYYVKWRLLNSLINDLGEPKNILIAGLPGKYGLSLDLIMLAQHFNIPVTVIDERVDRLDKLIQALERLREQNILTIEVKIVKVNSLSQPEELGGQKFDYIFNSEVLQQLNGQTRIDFANQVIRRGSRIVLFAPNAGNLAHARVSRLATLSLKDLSAMTSVLPIKIFKSGYLDLPPFPPGLQRSPAQREKAKAGKVEKVLMRILEIWGNLEKFLPGFVKNKKAHLIYQVLIYG